MDTQNFTTIKKFWRGLTQTLGPIGSAVLTFLDTNKQTDNQSLYIDEHKDVELCFRVDSSF